MAPSLAADASDDCTKVARSQMPAVPTGIAFAAVPAMSGQVNASCRRRCARHWCLPSGSRADPTGPDHGEERLHRLRLSQGGANGAGAAHQSDEPAGQAVANLRVLRPNQHARQSLDHCVSPRYRNALEHQVARANHDSDGAHTPQTLTGVIGAAPALARPWRHTGLDVACMHRLLGCVVMRAAMYASEAPPRYCLTLSKLHVCLRHAATCAGQAHGR